METEKLPIIYILSLSSSGSTLLDLLLGAHPNIWTIGEAHTLPQQLKENRLCGCGASLIGCEFWQSVLHKISLNSSSFSIDYFRRKDTESKFLRWSRFLGLICGVKTRDQARAIDVYGRANYEYFSTVKKVAEMHRSEPVRWLVDASKSIFRLQWLHESGYFDIRVVYLVKDPRAFVHSMVKAYSKKSELQNAAQSVTRFAIRWLVSNGLALILCKSQFSQDHVIRFRYDQLAGAPQSTLNEISDWLGLDYSDQMIIAFRNYETHAIAGSKMRWQNTEIYLDEEWKEVLSRKDGLISWLITWPLAKLYKFQR